MFCVVSHLTFRLLLISQRLKYFNLSLHMPVNAAAHETRAFYSRYVLVSIFFFLLFVYRQDLMRAVCVYRVIYAIAMPLGVEE